MERGEEGGRKEGGNGRKERGREGGGDSSVTSPRLCSWGFNPQPSLPRVEVVCAEGQPAGRGGWAEGRRAGWEEQDPVLSR